MKRKVGSVWQEEKPKKLVFHLDKRIICALWIIKLKRITLRITHSTRSGEYCKIFRHFAIKYCMYERKKIMALSLEKEKNFSFKL